MNIRKKLLPPNGPQPVSYYSHGIRVGPVLYTAGQTSRDVTNMLVGADDPGQQAQQAFKNLLLVLAEGGMDVSNVVRLSILVRRITDIKIVLEVKEKIFNPYLPTMTIARTKGLAYPEYLLEVDAIAVKHSE
jgi:2-iminobutanoate/2-iminopropanoate deaminase